MKTSIPHVIAVLKLPRSSKGVLAFAKSVATALGDNATTFPTPSPPLATLNADIAALDAAESAALTRAKGAAETRNAKEAVVKGDLEHLQSYVQQVANADPSNGAAIIESAGMGVRKPVVRTKSEISVEHGAVSGSVKIVAKAVGPRASYEWQYSTDQKTWTELPTTLQAKTTVIGLTPATSYFFRFRGVTKAGEGNWSQVVSLLVS